MAETQAKHRTMHRRLRSLESLISFKFRQRLGGVHVPDNPAFGDNSSTDYFKRCLSQSKLYIEYGSGGSTVLAARLQKKFISVESDSYFLEAVRKKIQKEIGETDGKLVHANIGVTEEWGTPFIKRKSQSRLRRWRKYADAPWSLTESAPDLVLIDGRFRVLCVLVTILNIGNLDVEILLDDYISRRAAYGVIERFARVEKVIGEMVSIRPIKFQMSDLQDAIRFYGSEVT